MPGLHLTLERVPLHKQIYAKALLDMGAGLNAVADECSIGKSTVVAIKRKTDYGTSVLEAAKRSMPAAFYAIAGLSMSKVSPSKLDACSAPQLMMVAGIAVDKARDMEGSNRPIFNIVNVVNDAQRTIAKLDAQMSIFTTAINQNAQA